MKDLNKSFTNANNENNQNGEGGEETNNQNPENTNDNGNGNGVILTAIPGKTNNIMQMDRVNAIAEKFDRLLNTTLAPDGSLDSKVNQALTEINEIGTLDSIKLKDKTKSHDSKSIREFQNDIIKTLIMKVKLVTVSNIQKNSNKLQRKEIEVLLETSKQNRETN